MLIVELDGAQSEVEGLFQMVEAICHRTGGTEILIARNNDERARIWKGRKAAFAAMGRVSPNYYVQDGVIPRTKLGEVLGRIRALEERSGLRIGNVFHAGDGNLHPLICYDEQIPGPGRACGKSRVGNPDVLHRSRRIDYRRARRRRRQIGVDGEDVYGSRSRDDAAACATRSIPTNICNPGKVFPTPRMCGEVPGPYRQHPAEKAGLADRM